MRKSIAKQQGHAAILFALTIPAMWGFFTLAIDGSHAIQTKARLGDAAEVAALALAAQNSHDDADNNRLAMRYIDAYVPEADISIKKIDRTECHVSNSKACDGASGYAQYEIDVSIDQTSWLPTLEFAGFDESYEVVHSATARKYQGDSIDIAFVIDYSGSMNDQWQGKKKYLQVRDIINDVLSELEEQQGVQSASSRVALISYSEFTDRPYDNLRCNYYYEPLQFVDEFRYFPNSTSLDLDRTIRDLWQDKSQDKENICAYYRYDSDDMNRRYNFKNLMFTKDFNLVNKTLKTFEPYGWTASPQGIIKAAQLFDKIGKPNPRQLLVILSDGIDLTGSGENPLRGYVPTAALVERGMCDDIRSRLNSRFTEDNRPVNFQMAFIGFDYTVNDNRALADCVGLENVYDAADPDELLDIILNLISEEIGHLK